MIFVYVRHLLLGIIILCKACQEGQSAAALYTSSGRIQSSRTIQSEVKLQYSKRSISFLGQVRTTAVVSVVDRPSSQSSHSTTDVTVLDELSDERKASLFQFLLRDLQVEGTPLLSLDIQDPTVLQAALWTTAAELAEQEDINDDDAPKKACFILEDMTVQDLRTFVEFYEGLRANDELTKAFPELLKIRFSLLGKGVGPAIFMESNRNHTHSVTSTSHFNTPSLPHSQEIEHRIVAAMKMFVDRTFLGTFPQDSISYRTCMFTDIFHIQSSFWNCLCELIVKAEASAGAGKGGASRVFFLVPNLLNNSSEGSNSLATPSQPSRFMAWTTLLNQNMQISSIFASHDSEMMLSYYSPTYDRGQVLPFDLSVAGHLPPFAQFSSDISSSKNQVDSKEHLQLLNYLRRSPVHACLIHFKNRGMQDEPMDEKELFLRRSLEHLHQTEVNLASQTQSNSRFIDNV